jgi:hypothetical protein
LHLNLNAGQYKLKLYLKKVSEKGRKKEGDRNEWRI